MCISQFSIANRTGGSVLIAWGRPRGTIFYDFELRYFMFWDSLTAKYCILEKPIEDALKAILHFSLITNFTFEIPDPIFEILKRRCKGGKNLDNR